MSDNQSAEQKSILIIRAPLSEDGFASICFSHQPSVAAWSSWQARCSSKPRPKPRPLAQAHDCTLIDRLGARRIMRRVEGRASRRTMGCAALRCRIVQTIDRTGMSRANGESGRPRVTRRCLTNERRYVAAPLRGSRSPVRPRLPAANTLAVSFPARLRLASPC